MFFGIISPVFGANIAGVFRENNAISPGSHRNRSTHAATNIVAFPQCCSIGKKKEGEADY
jgi:hypothetical protein